jgi:transposase-like protein
MDLMDAFKGVEIFKFQEKFCSEDACKSYLFQEKFRKGFKCPKCNHTHAYQGIKPYTMVCKSCRYIESSTSDTLYHRIKFGLVKAFNIQFEITNTCKGVSVNHISSKYGINYKTAHLFMKKVKVAMESSTEYPMMGKVYVDEFVIGGFEKGAVGRKTDSKKIKVIMAVETTDKGKIKRVYSMKIADYSAHELRKIFDKHISKQADVYTDEWKGYIPLSKEWNITQNKKYKNNSPVNRMIQQLKSWIRGTHHSISHYHTETYLNEFSFRINRSLWKDVIFHKSVERMVKKDKKCRLELSKIQCRTREQFVEKIRQNILWDVKYEVRYGKVKTLKMVA